MSVHWLHPRETFLLSALAWAAMMGVMMAPTAAPWIAAFHRFDFAGAHDRRRLQQSASFAAGYFAIWMLFGFAVALLQLRFSVPATWSGPTLAGAGLFQFTPLKRACLTHCRNPISFLLTQWRLGPPSPMRVGLSHGVYCVGCCWALMLTAVAVGSLGAWWMLALMAITFAEQAMPWGSRLRVPVGLGLIASGVIRGLELYR